MTEYLLWISVFIVFYVYVGYGILLAFVTRLPNLRYLFKMPEGYGVVNVNPHPQCITSCSFPCVHDKGPPLPRQPSVLCPLLYPAFIIPFLILRQN